MEFRVRELRKSKCLTQIELCKKANISRQTLIDIENGKEINVMLTTLEKIASALSCNVRDLLCF